MEQEDLRIPAPLVTDLINYIANVPSGNQPAGVAIMLVQRLQQLEPAAPEESE